MKIACWSGPRNISTALLRSWSSRYDTFVSDEPFYAFYLKKTNFQHPMREEIIQSYSTNYEEIIKNLISKNPKNKKIWYQKQMAHHLINIKDLSWINNFENCILIRHPKYVINSYIKKNDLKNVDELGFPQQLSIIEYLKSYNLKFFIIDADDLLSNPKKTLFEWCNFLKIDFDEKMLSWPKGPHKNDGIWGQHWYDNINNSNGFYAKSPRASDDYKKFEKIYKQALSYYKKIYNMKI
tara:strand:+ start:21757 stop:22470 length:714 start_codon:yes stop_codon:yes gene_type:complete